MAHGKLLSAVATACLLTLPALAAEVGSTLEEIEKLAREEGVVRVGVSWQGPIVDEVKKNMLEKYGVTVELVELRALASRERALSEAIAGVVEYDMMNVSGELQPLYVESGVLEPQKWQELFPQIPGDQFSPDGYFVAAAFSRYGIVYNPTMVPEDKRPVTWEDCLDPYWAGKDAMYTRPRTFTALWNAWGEEKMLDFQKKILALDPIWTADQTSTLLKIAAGEYPLGCGYPAQSLAIVLDRDPSAKDRLTFVIPKELPVHIGEAFAVMKGGVNKNAAVLMAGFLASAEGQKLYELYNRDSPFVEGTEASRLVAEAGATVSFGGWEFAGEKEAEAANKIVEAWGFPTGQ